MNIATNIMPSHVLYIITATTSLTIFLNTVPYYALLLTLLYIASISYTLYNKQLSILFVVLLSMIFSLCAAFRMNQQLSSYTSNQELLQSPVTIEGCVYRLDHSTLIKNQTTIHIKTSCIKNKKKKLTDPQYITIFLPTKRSLHLQENQHIRIYNCKLSQPANNTKYQQYLLKEGIWAIAYCSNHTIYIIKKPPYSYTQIVQKTLQNNISHTSFSLFNMLFLGKKEKEVSSLNAQHQCILWGIAHHTARSGAHLTILLGLLLLLLHYAQLHYILRYLFCMALLWGYALISYSSISFIRALLMSMLFILCKTCKRLPSSLHIITLVTLVIALYNPIQFFFLDFQLSFGITYMIIWLFNVKKSTTIAFFSTNSVRS